jgi:saccharopine dehydrogenase-like NADP-dependent oxidoreductase
VPSKEWVKQHAGYILLGIISKATKEGLKKSMQETMDAISTGILNPNMRVRHSALNALGMLSTDLAPVIQKKYHQQILNVLVQLLTEEKSLKMKTQVVSVVLNFIQGFVTEDTEDEDFDG